MIMGISAWFSEIWATVQQSKICCRKSGFQEDFYAGDFCMVNQFWHFISLESSSWVHDKTLKDKTSKRLHIETTIDLNVNTMNKTNIELTF